MHHLPVQAMVIAASREALERLKGQLHRSSGLDASRIHGLHSANFSDIISAIHAWRPAAAILPFALVKGSSERIHGLENAIDIPILIVK